MSPRYVIANMLDPLPLYMGVDLPDAEHIHVHIAPDGTITATPMKRPFHRGSCEVTAMGPCTCGAERSWVDA